MSDLLPLQIGRSYLPLLHFRDDVILVEGRRGTLKTCSVLDVLMSRGFNWPGTTFYLWRSTRKLLTDSVLQALEEFILPKWRAVPGMRLLNPAVKRESRSEYVFENGSRFIPEGMDSISRGQSASCAGGYLAEAVELDKLSRVNALIAMLRQPGAEFHQLIVDCNPGPENHFINLAAESVDNSIRQVDTPADYERLQRHNYRRMPAGSTKWKRIISKVQDNPYFFDLPKWKMTAAGVDYERKLGHQAGHIYKNWVLGEWANAEGGVFPEFGKFNIVKPFKVPSHWPRWVMYDPGHGHPTGISFVAMSPARKLIVYDEIYTPGYDVATFANWIQEKEAKEPTAAYDRRIDPRHGNQHTAQSARSISEMMAQDHGLVFDDWPLLSGLTKTDGVESLRQWVKDQRLLVFDNCVNCVNEFQSWRYKHDTSGVIRTGDDAYEDCNNEILDGLIGLVAMNPDPGPVAITSGPTERIRPDDLIYEAVSEGDYPPGETW